MICVCHRRMRDRGQTPDGVQPALSLVGAPVLGFSPCSFGFLQSFFRSNWPMYASVKSALVRSASSKEEPESTALLSSAPRNDAPLKYARSMT